MAKKLKTFNLEENTYSRFSKHCKEHGISMSKKIENFIKLELDKLTPSKAIQSKKTIPTENHSFSKYC